MVSGAFVAHHATSIGALAFQKGAIVTRFDQSSHDVDTAMILRSIGDVAYEWHFDTDALTRSGNAGDLLGADLAGIATGRAFARNVDAEGSPTRADIIQQATQRDAGSGVPYQIQYAFRRGDEMIWVEDTGPWFAGPDGTPQRAARASASDQCEARSRTLARTTGEI
jgi:hypothetical protein